jgi:hypothetical protein
MGRSRSATRWGAAGLLAAAVLAAGCGRDVPEAATPDAAPNQPVVRPAAWAGRFYPNSGEELAEAVAGYLAEADGPNLPSLRAVVCPHAGYRFSAATAAFAYKPLVGRRIETAVVLAPSHYAAFSGASIPDVTAYQTPLGRMRLSPLARRLAASQPFGHDLPCDRVRRPQGWRTMPIELPPFGQDTPHTWEHSLEVQIPFLQTVAPNAELVPIVYGKTDPRQVASALAGCLDDRTVLVASSDLCHYYPYGVARQLDGLCVRAILDLDVEHMDRHEACGKAPILTLMHLARRFGWRGKLLDYRNSGDTAGQKRSVVGYAAIAFCGALTPAPTQTAPWDPPPQAGRYDADQRRYLLELARRTLRSVVADGNLPAVDANTVPPPLREPRGCFVTLTKSGRLRGCIGHIQPRLPLVLAVMDCARSAALRDKRFDPVGPEELGDIDIEVSVLTVPQPLDFESPVELLARLRPHVDGVVLRVGSRQATYLPQVWDQMSNKLRFMGALSRKAKLPAAAWQRPDARVWTYQAEAFQEGGG